MGAVALVKAGHTSPNMLPALEKAASQAERAGKIISRIREFVKRSEPRRQRVAIGRIVDNAIGFAEIDARKRRIRIDSFVPSNAPDVLADPILIEQVLLNLLKNGLEAMEKSESDELKVAVILHEQHIEAVVDRGHGLPSPSACSNLSSAPSPRAWAWG